MSVIVTVGIPMYNRIDGFERALKSVMAQTYQHLEILLSNDCSPNPAVDLLSKKYVETDSRIKYTYQSSSLRTVGNFAWLKNNARGKYFLWLADDDWLNENYIEKCVAFLEGNTGYSIAGGTCLYHESEKVILHTGSSFSIEQNSYEARLFHYFRTVTLNGYFYGLLRTELIKDFPLPNQLGFDWNIVAYCIFKGKIKILKNTGHHISKGGMSNEGSGLSNYFLRQSYLSKNFIGLSTSLNCAGNVFSSGKYDITVFRKWILSVLIFIATYLNTLQWDLLMMKRRLIKMLGINKQGVIFRPRK